MNIDIHAFEDFIIITCIMFWVVLGIAIGQTIRAKRGAQK